MFMRVCMHVCISAFVYTYVCMCIYVHVYILYIYIYIYIYIYLLYAYIYIYIYILNKFVLYQNSIQNWTRRSGCCLNHEIINFFTVNFIYLLIFFLFIATIFVFQKLTKCKNIVGKPFDNSILTNSNYSILQVKFYMGMCVIVNM